MAQKRSEAVDRGVMEEDKDFLKIIEQLPKGQPACNKAALTLTERKS